MCSSSHPIPAQSHVYSRREIEGLIANGSSVIIVGNEVLKLDAWLMHHPGGHKTIQHMIGRDATDEITAYVSCLCLFLA